MNDESRIPPNDLQAERCVIGCMMLANSTIDAVQEIIQPRDFYSDAHGEIARAVYTLRESGVAVDYLTLADQMRASNTLEEIGGPDYIIECFRSVPEHHGNDWDASHWARIVAKCSRRRKAIVIGQRLIEDSYNAGKDDEATRDAAAAAANALASTLPSGKSRQPRSLGHHIDELVANLRLGITAAKHDGIPEIDRMIGGTCGGEVIVIAASTHHGKTLVGLQWLHAAARNGVTCGMISEEMSAAALAARTVSSVTLVREDDWRRDVEQVAIDAAAHAESHNRILIAEKCSSIGAVERVIADLVERSGVSMVAVDYAQLLRGDGGNRQERVADVSVRLKNAAMKHDIRLILLAQLNREIDRRDDPTPKMSDIADTSQIAKDSDVMLMLFHPHQFDSSYEDPTEFRIYHPKNRNRGNKIDRLLMRLNLDRLCIEPYEKNGAVNYDNANDFR